MTNLFNHLMFKSLHNFFFFFSILKQLKLHNAYSSNIQAKFQNYKKQLIYLDFKIRRSKLEKFEEFKIFAFGFETTFSI